MGRGRGKDKDDALVVAGALGVLARAALFSSPSAASDDSDPEPSPSRRAAAARRASRALRALSRVDRVPAGDWPGALRRLVRLARGVGDGDGFGKSARSAVDRRARDDLYDACIALAVAHPGTAVGAGLLERLLGDGGDDDDDDARACDVDVDGWSGGDVTGSPPPLAALPPSAVLRDLGACVRSLPRSAAVAALRRCADVVARACVAAASDASDPEPSRRAADAAAADAAADAAGALWTSLSDASARLPRGPWPERELVDAARVLVGALRDPRGAIIDHAVAHAPRVGGGGRRRRRRRR